MSGRLYRMRDLKGYKIADAEPDIRGWEVRTMAGSQVGEVDDLLIDPHRGEVVLLDIDLNESGRHVNVPIRGVQLDRDRKVVVVDSGDLRDADAKLNREHAPDREIDERARDVRAQDDRALDASREKSYDRGVRKTDADEVVIEERPVVMEEVVVRRRRVDGEDADRAERE